MIDIIQPFAKIICYDKHMTYLSDNFDGQKANPQTLFDIERKRDKLLFHFIAQESCLYSFSKENNSDLWRGCVCEVFLDLGDDFYYEFEVAPNGATFIAKIKDRKITFFDCDFFVSEAKVEGNTYSVTMQIDLAKLSNPPFIRYNAFRVETRPNEKEQNLSALNPTLCETFHIRDKFIKLS